MPEEYDELINLYSKVRSQLLIGPMGDVISLNYTDVLSIIKLYVSDESLHQEIFEDILMLHNIEQELTPKTTS